MHIHKKLSGSFIASCMAVTLTICTINNESYNQNNKILLFLFIMYESRDDSNSNSAQYSHASLNRPLVPFSMENELLGLALRSRLV